MLRSPEVFLVLLMAQQLEPSCKMLRFPCEILTALQSQLRQQVKQEKVGQAQKGEAWKRKGVSVSLESVHMSSSHLATPMYTTIRSALSQPFPPLSIQVSTQHGYISLSVMHVCGEVSTFQKVCF